MDDTRWRLGKNESDYECCVREIAEETGVLVETSECLLEIDEYVMQEMM